MGEKQLELLKELRKFGCDVRDDIVQALFCVEHTDPAEATKAHLDRAFDNMKKLLHLVTQIERPWEKQE